MRHPTPLRLSVFFSVLLLLPLAALAQTTGGLFGVVTDNTGAVLPGVTVTVTSPQLQGSRTAVTNAQGEYSLQLLPPGTYRIAFELAGLGTVTRENVRVSIDTTTREDATLGISAVTEAITVTAEAVVVDPTQTTVQQNFGEQHLEYATVGTAGRSYQSVLQQAPGVAGGSNPQVMGANLGQNVYLLDGVNTTDPVTHTFGSNLPFDAIQEVSVQTLGKDARYRAVGGVVNVVTRSGGNQFEGTLDVRYNSNELAESGEHFEAEENEADELRPSATFGGPILRDRLWFFLSGQRPSTTAFVAPLAGANFTAGAREFEGADYLAKLTAAPANNHNLQFRYTTNNAEISHAEFSPFYRPEAGAFQAQDSTIYNLGYDVVLNPAWLAQVQAGMRDGFLETRPMSGDVTAAGAIDLVTSVRSQNYTNWQFSDRDRQELIASTTYFTDAFAGSHTFEGGINFDHAEFSTYNNATGTAPAALCAEEFGQPAGAQCGIIYYFAGGVPFAADVSTIIPEETYESDTRAFYIQDEWHPITPITLRLGVRYDTMDFRVPRFEDAPEFSKWQPRVGAAWDIFNNASSIVHGFWGQVMDDTALTLASFGSTLGSVTSQFLWNGGDEFEFDSAIGGASGNAYDPNLRPTYSNEANLGFTQRIWTNTSIDVTAVWRESEDIFEDTCVNQETCPFFWMTNAPNGDEDLLRSQYRGIIARFESRPFNWLSGLISYTYSESEGSIEYTQNAGADFDIDPDHFVNRFGYLSDDARHRVKASGFVRAPFGTTFGFNFDYNSGLPYNVTAARPPNSGYGTLFVEPRGSRRLDDVSRMDLQVQHEFTLGRVTMGLIGSVLNLFNTETATEVGMSIGNYANCRATDAVCIDNPLFGNGEDRPGFERLRVSSASFGQPTVWQRPRRYEVGVRFEF